MRHLFAGPWPMTRAISSMALVLSWLCAALLIFIAVSDAARDGEIMRAVAVHDAASDTLIIVVRLQKGAKSDSVSLGEVTVPVAYRRGR